MNNLSKWLVVDFLLPLVLFVAALVIRTYALAEIPPGLWLDEAAYGLDALDVQQGHYAIFFPRNNGREPLFIYWQALVMSLVGASPYALRLGAALIGAATVPATYWLVRHLLRESDLPASWGAFWVALALTFGYWHLTMSRLGFRAITLPLFSTLALIFFWRAWPRWRAAGKMPWADLILCGMLVGLTLYTYTAGRFIPVLVLLTVAAAWVLQPEPAVRQRLALGLGVIGLSAAVVFAPLGFYFLRHPEYFLAHAAEVSVLSKEYAGDNPLLALADSAWKTAQMFLWLPDGNLRHNPAGRPIFDPLLAGWLLVGLFVALWRWRSLPYLFTLLWVGLLSLPALLTSEGVPHSLRSLGMIPAIYILPVLGMMWASQQLGHRWRRWTLWLPLPFLLFSAISSGRDYFGAWQDLERFRKPLLIDYAQSAAKIAEQNPPETVWLLPFSPSYAPAEGMPFYYTFAFFLVEPHVANGTVVASEVEAPVTLTQLTRDQRFAHVFQLDEQTFSRDYYAIYRDVKKLVTFLLQKHGRLRQQSDGSDVGIPYARYELPQNSTYSVSEDPQPTALLFADKVKLITVDYGPTMLDPAEPASARNRKQAPAGHQLWAVLRWQPQSDLDFDLKASLLLKDDQGHLAGQVDDLLVGDHYPALRIWPTGEIASTYQIMPIAAAIPPGRYRLYVKVYEEKTGRIYPAHAETGQNLGTEAQIGKIEITPGPTTPEPIPSTMTVMQTLAPNLRLAGYDLARSQVAPGDKLSAQLIWQALAKLDQDYTMRLRLRAADGTVVAEQVQRPGNDGYSTRQWRQDELLREWRDLLVPPTTPAGTYELLLQVEQGGQAVGEINLGAIDVSGRPRLFTPPPVAQPVTATFGAQVQLLGVDAPSPLTLTPGTTLPLTLTWQVLTTPPTPLIRFVHLLNAAGQVVAQQDAPPCNGECPATSWLENEILVDQALLALPADLPAGDYRLAVGWYEQETQQRLAGMDGNGQRLPDQILVLPIAMQVN